MGMRTLLHIAERAANGKVWTPAFREALKEFGELEIVENGGRLSDEECAERIRACDVLLTCWGARAAPRSIARNPGRLKYICHVTGELKAYIPLEIIESDIPVTNWGDAPAQGVAEGAMALLLACVKNLRRRIENFAGGTAGPADVRSFTLEGMKVGVYGLGVIGRRFVEMLLPFRAVVRVFDPYVSDLPQGCVRADSLEALFHDSEAVVIHAALTDETRDSVTASLLALLPDNGILVNTARGAIIDQDALFAELKKGRLAAGLDVLRPRTEIAAEMRELPNFIYTAHSISGGESIMPSPGRWNAMHRVCLDNLRRFVSGEPLRFLMDRTRYLRST